jgi:hypothetical protein
MITDDYVTYSKARTVPPVRHRSLGFEIELGLIRQVRTDLFDDGVECGGVGDGEFAEHLAEHETSCAVRPG